MEKSSYFLEILDFKLVWNFTTKNSKFERGNLPNESLVYTMNYLVSHGVVWHEPSPKLWTVHYQRQNHVGRLLYCTNQEERETLWWNISTSQTTAICSWSEHKRIVIYNMWNSVHFGWNFIRKYFSIVPPEPILYALFYKRKPLYYKLRWTLQKGSVSSSAGIQNFQIKRELSKWCDLGPNIPYLVHS